MAIVRTLDRDVVLPTRFRRKKTNPQHSFRILGCYPENFQPLQFMREIDDSNTDSHLCERCRRIDFRAIFDLDYGSLPEVGKPVFELLDFQRTTPQTVCSLCRLFSKMIFEYDCSPRDMDDEIWSWSGGKSRHQEQECDDYHFRAYRNAAFDQSNSETVMPAKQCEVVVGVVKGPVIGINHAIARHTLTSRSTLRKMNPHPLLGNSFTAYETSLPLLEKVGETASAMLYHCLRNHEKCGHGQAFISSARGWDSDSACLTSESTNWRPPRFPIGARVIHCMSRRILPLAKGMKYLALSYVWGVNSTGCQQTLPSAASEFGMLPGMLPRTIEDAINLTLRLGFQYVWVDRYCIEQHHSGDKQHQISQMSTIYSTAVATICALGSDDNAGIAGVSTPVKYTSAFAQDLQLISIVHKVRHHIRRSVWSTRGWTLQEVMVSPRCLLFTEEGVTTICRAGHSNERTILKNSFRKDKAEFDRIGLLFVTENRPDNETPYAIERNPESTPFLVLRNEYQKRSLGYDEDAYNAFSAILSRLRTPTYWGLMNQGHPDRFIKNGVRREDWSRYSLEGVTIGFAHALTWRVVDPFLSKLRKSLELPSWSWVSQTGRIEDWLLREDPLFCPEISVVSQDEKTCQDIGSSFWLSGCRSLIPCESRYLIIKSMVVDWELSGRLEGNKEPQVGIYPFKIGKWTLSGGQYPSNTKSYIHFDNREANDDTRLPRRGKAILLTMTGQKYHQDLYWIAIAVCDDGTYRRIGVISTSFAHEDFGYYVYKPNAAEYKELPDSMQFVPPAEYVKSIWLG